MRKAIIPEEAVRLENKVTSFSRIEIDLDRLKKNFHTALSLVKQGTVVTCVLKANAYGHGATQVARTLQKEGCQSFAVSCAREAIQLRSGGITGEILVMGICENEWINRLSHEKITVTVSSLEQAQMLCAPVNVQIKVDTGLHRLGFSADAAGIRDILMVNHLPNVHITGLYSHLGLTDTAHDHAQHDRLMNVWDALKANGLHISDVHICDSIGMVRYPAFQHTRVRIGAFLYGVRPMGSEQMPFECLQTLRLLSTITRVHWAFKGDYVGYDDTQPLLKDTLIATIQTGYGDGYPRRMAKKASVLIRGHLAPVISLVCMDQMMVDVTDISAVSVGDEVTLLGDSISYMTYADWASSNRNEAIASLSQRPVRIYIENGVPQFVADTLAEGLNE